MSQRQLDMGPWEAGERNSPDLALIEVEELAVPPVERDQLRLEFFVDLTGDDPVVELRDPTVINHRLQDAPRWQLAVKRGIDVVGASVLLVILSPVMLLTAPT